MMQLLSFLSRRAVPVAQLYETLSLVVCRRYFYGATELIYEDK